MSDRQIAVSRRLLLSLGGAALLTACGSAARENAMPPVAPGTSAPAQPTPAAAAASTAAAPSFPSPAPLAAVPKEPEYYVHAGPGQLALTFDDGPSPTYTPQVLGILRQYGATATFFMIGANVEKHPDILRQVVAAGHQVANHTWSHPDLGTLSEAEVRGEIERTNEIITRVGRVRPPILFRAPGGHFTRTSMSVCASLGLHPVAWSVDPVDWSRPGTQAIVDQVLDAAKPGSIVLNHDGALLDPGESEIGGFADRSETVAALKTYLPRLIDAGYTFTLPDPAR
ncbi:polysaccharide deacetylase family protein [Kitasatospora sp. NPDC056138]|uniref:polysaccharide deacetylase family protein n=1 Tax=Kitasatospora sp. NPDC056138 TaxID=3345724 RepID=UPI0035DFD5CD